MAQGRMNPKAGRESPALIQLVICDKVYYKYTLISI